MFKKSKNILIKSLKYITLIFVLIDFVLINFSFYLSTFILFTKYHFFDNENYNSIILFTNLIWILLMGTFGTYKIMRIEPIEKILARNVNMILSLISILFLLVFALKFITLVKLLILIFSVSFLFLNLILKTLLLITLKYLRKYGINNKNVVIVGVNKNGLAIENILKKEVSYGYKVLGFFTIDEDENTVSSKIIGHIDVIERFLIENNVDEVYFASMNYAETKAKKLITFCDKNFIRFKIIPNFNQFTLNRHVNIDFYDDLPVLILRKEPLENVFNQFIKRLFDVVFSFFVIIIILPWLYPIVTIIQKLTSKGPVLFVQLRSGQDNKVFKCLKFRTMFENDKANEIGTIDNDPRITPFGKFLRKSRIDELPQFINVFLGQMSVVGPRPHMLKHTEEYSKLIDEFLIRQFVKPGITGWAQTTGYIDESQKLQEMKDKVKNDIWYIENWSFALDIKIIILTILNIFKGDKNAK